MELLIEVIGLLRGAGTIFFLGGGGKSVDMPRLHRHISHTDCDCSKLCYVA